MRRSSAYFDLLHSPSHDNVVKDNEVHGNLGNSCFDDVGPGATWTNNAAEDNSSNPDGICGASVP